VNGASFDMVEVEGGTFLMGGTPDQGDGVRDREKPVHQVTLSSYNIGQTEVTQELWKAVMGENPSYHVGDLQRPVEQVSWVDCQRFIEKLNQLTGKSFRLPTEAEWEYAARGGSKSEGYMFAGSNDMDVVAWYVDNSDNTTHPVATKAPNELGLYDMTGNVWEWVYDWFAMYSADSQVNPTGPGTGNNRVLRGGCWNGGGNYNRVAYRDNFTPTGSNSSGGMRLVLDVEESTKFRLSESVIKIEVGESTTVNILNGGGSYTLMGGTDFFTTSTNGDQLTVTGITAGTSTVYVTDAETGATAILVVIVTERQDKEFTVNGVTFKMVTVDGDTFTMGATAEQGNDFNANERPVHQVTLSDYSIGQTEVTQELWVAVMGSNPSNFSGDMQRPVDKVSWNDCQEFISKLNQLTGKSFRLPTEAEWEFAARGGRLSLGYKYAGSNTVDDVAWYKDNGESATHPVGTKAPNELGLYDMSGNVFEWCQDWYGNYSGDEQINPTGPASGTYRSCRGGGWNYSSSYCRVSYRSYHSMTSRYDRIGLRLALDPEESVTPSDDEEFVDLGLPSGTLWATKNIGAMSPEDYGDYFDLGIEWEDYLCHGNKRAYKNSTLSWEWPTSEQLSELVDDCIWSWTTRNGVNGFIVTGPNNNSLFLPAAGYYYFDENGLGSLDGEADYCTYWSSTISYRPHGYDYAYASCLSCSPSEVCMTIDLISNKRPVRPVLR
jgi:formylglycine-generating enzyme required for sulfatase activity